MKVFLDTNVVLEVILQREQSAVSKQIVKYMIGKDVAMYISAASFYTMIFVTEKYLKKNWGLTGNDKVEALRIVLEETLKTYSIAEHDNSSLLKGIKDVKFNDLEDSCQYQLAQKTGCDLLITFNPLDYSNAEKKNVEVLTPQQFIEKYA